MILLKKILSYVSIILILGLGLTYLIYNDPLPVGKEGKEADILANKMLTALNKNAFLKTKYLEWTFSKGNHHYKWDKNKGIATVNWKQYSVTLNFSNPSKNRVLISNKEISSEKKKELIEKATGYFNNDSFWLVAPYKVFDKGTERSIVTLDNGEKSLLITYSKGGSTPGDSYLWKLNSQGMPESFKMWVKILPIGGLEASWNDWKVMPNGISLPTSHKIGPLTISMGKVKAF